MSRPKGIIDPEIGNRFKQVREKMNMTQQTFAKKYYKSLQTIRNYEHGRRRVPIELIKEVSKDNGIDASFILGTDSQLNQNIVDKSKFLYDKNKKFIDYIESLGYELLILPSSARINEGEYTVTSEVTFSYQIFKDKYPVRCFDENNWIRLQTQVSSIFGTLIE